MFSKAIVRKPGESMVNGLTNAELGKPILELAQNQHDEYIRALESCGLEVTILNSDENHPDSTFVEDTAILTPECAIITNPGADSRKGEILSIQKTLKAFYKNIEEITGDGTVDGGDIMMVGRHFYIGLSKRTNREGANQLAEILKMYKMTASMISLNEVLHLKSGLSYLEKNNLVITGEFLEKKEFDKFNKLVITDNEAYASNCVWVNDKVLTAKGFPNAKAKIEAQGYDTIELDVSEFRKLDGGLSCLSLRF